MSGKKFTKRKMYIALFKEFFWFYKESFSFMGHQPKVITFFQAIPKSFGFTKEQYKYYREYL